MCIVHKDNLKMITQAPVHVFSKLTSLSMCNKLRRLCPCHSTRNLKSLRNIIHFYCTKAKEVEIPLECIRNFSIIAHVDHGKSTLADRLLEITGAISHSKENKQVLDRLQVEKERGITVKAVAASLKYKYDGKDYLLNLIDTPGHVDFANEVSRSLAACQGVILLIDANDGIQAQTVANFYLAFTQDLTIIPVINKIDLKNADPERVERQLKSLFAINPEQVYRISAKTGLNVKSVLQAIVDKVPPPAVDRSAPFRALIIDSWFSQFRGPLSFIYVAEGSINKNDQITSIKSGKNYIIKSVGILRPEEVEVETLQAGQVGVISCNMKTADEATVGDTLVLKGLDSKPLKELPPPKSMVFSGLFPPDQSQFQDLKGALKKLCLNDHAVTIATDSSPALGFGWRLGFLGLLHLDVFRQRLEQEYGTEAVLTAPSVTYKVKLQPYEKVMKTYGGADEILVTNPVLFPEKNNIAKIYEPFVLATIVTPFKYSQVLADECLERRGLQKSSTCIDGDQYMLKFEMPLSEVIIDFHDVLKRLSSGFASFDYEDIGFVESDVVKVNFLINGKEVEEMSLMAHSSRAKYTARTICQRLKESIPRQQILIIIQGVVNGKILTREEIKPYRKDVTAKLHAADPSRRKKLLQAQSEGKKKMRAIANVLVPRDTFINVLRKKHN